MVRPVSWYDTYWMMAAGLLIVVAALLYNRGLNLSLKERWQLVPERFDRATKWWTLGLIVLFIGVGGYIYYNVSYLNEWLTKGEGIERAALYEKALKKYQQEPLPKMTRLVEWVDIYPEQKQERVRANVTIANKTGQPIREMLLDGDELTDYSDQHRRKTDVVQLSVDVSEGDVQLVQTGTGYRAIPALPLSRRWRRGIPWCWS